MCSFSSTRKESLCLRQVSPADKPPGPEPTITTSSTSPPGAAGRALRSRAMCSITARPRFAAFLTSGLPATSPIKYWPGTAVWKWSSSSGTVSMRGVVPSRYITSAWVGQALAHCSHCTQSPKRATLTL